MIELTTRRGQRKIKFGLQIIALCVGASLDFIRGTLFRPSLHDLLVFSDRQDQPRMETVYALDTSDLAAEVQILLFERDVSERAR